MDLGLKNKNALLTGATHGIGLASAIELAKEGCDVCVFSSTKKNVLNAQSILDELGSNHVSVQADVFNPKELNYIYDLVIEKWGNLDVLVNNVGGGGRWGKEDILQTDDSVWDEVYEKNLKVSLWFTKKFLPVMLKNKWGRVITIASIYSCMAGGRPWFNIAKTAQMVLMKNLSQKKEFVSNNITFNTVAPGGVMIKDTGWDDLLKTKPEEFKKIVEDEYPMSRLGTVEEVASIVTFLSSEKASLINGANILADGGQCPSF